MATHRVTFIPGDGVGPEIAEATKACIGQIEKFTKN